MPDQRRVAGLHRLHADEEGVGEDAAAEEARRQPAGARITPGEVREVGRGGRGVEDQREPDA